MSEVNNLTAVRLEKRAAFLERGGLPYGGAFPVDGDVGDVRAAFAEGKKVAAAGRVTARRDMGKSHFLDISDHSGRIQVYLQDKALGDEGTRTYEILDIGDFVGIEGECFTTKTGEPSIKAEKFILLSKSLHPLPEKWHGLQDVEARHRQRYLDLISNEHARDIFRKRFAIIREIRAFFEERGFLEVETPMMQAVAGGAAANPFETHHNALGLDLYLRIAPELYLKRLLVGGFTKVFELNRNFRNEGVSRRHNPEFTMLEAYWFAGWPSASAAACASSTKTRMAGSRVSSICSARGAARATGIWSRKPSRAGSPSTRPAVATARSNSASTSRTAWRTTR
jgi:lysyl-tRNA synthetase class 2